MSDENINQPQDCQSMLDVRHAIDRLDEQLLDLLAQRLDYIKRAAQIKTSVDSIRDDQRIESIIAKRKSQAKKHGYSDVFIESIFRSLIEYSVEHEMQIWKQNN